MSAEADFWDAFRGRPEVLTPRATGSPTDAEGRAWLQAARALLAHLDELPAGTPAPVLGDLAQAPSDAEALPTVLSADLLGRAAFLAFDGAAHRRALSQAGRAAPRAGALGQLYLCLGEARQAILDGEALGDRGAGLESAASSLGHAPVVVEAAALRALGLLSSDVAEAVRTARRAARMARVEGMPLPELLANLSLARARRLSDQPHLAVRILRGLARFAPDPWIPWLRWELLFAGAVELAARLESVPGAPTARAVRAVEAALRARQAGLTGDRAAFDAAAGEGRRALATAPTLAAEFERFRVGADPEAAPEEGGSALAAWCRGQVPTVPHGLVGIALHERAPGEDVIGYVLVREAGARRFFGCGVGLAAAPCVGAGRGRTETAACVLALGGPEPQDKRAFFRAIYGFEYRRELHQGPLEVLVHRVRKALGERMVIERHDERIAARPQGAWVVPDPRCTKPFGERLLEVLAERSGSSAREVARALNVSVRTVQGAMKQLTGDGACVVERHGRQVVYRVEDTTFSEPTRQRPRRNLDLG